MSKIRHALRFSGRNLFELRNEVFCNYVYTLVGGYLRFCFTWQRWLVVFT